MTARGARAQSARSSWWHSCSSALPVWRSCRRPTQPCRCARRRRCAGRVMALWFVSFQGSTPIGGPIVGAVMGAYGARAGLGLGAVACFVVALRRVAGAALAARSRATAASGTYAGQTGVGGLHARSGRVRPTAASAPRRSATALCIADGQRPALGEPDQPRRAAGSARGSCRGPRCNGGRAGRRRSSSSPARSGVERDDPDPLHLRAANDEPLRPLGSPGMQQLLDRVGGARPCAARRRSRRRPRPRRRQRAGRRPRGCPARSARPRGSGRARRRARRR